MFTNTIPAGDVTAIINGGNPTASFKDVANDNWVYFGSKDFPDNASILDKYKKYNNPDGNFPDREKEERRGKLRPDKEELNNNKSLDITESYYKYEIPMPIVGTVDGFVLDTSDTRVKEFVTDVKEVIPNCGGKTELWYRIRVPISDEVINQVGSIDGLRSMQFMRMYFTDFKTPKTFRLAEFGMVRNQWRKDAFCSSDGSLNNAILNLDVVGLEENQNKDPFGYKSIGPTPTLRLSCCGDKTISPIFHEPSISISKTAS